MISAVEKKVLQLHSAAVASVTAGRIVNLISNDVRRFDDAAAFWVFLLAGPLELCIVFVLIGLKLGFAASIAGIATLLLLIPIQAVMARYIGRLRGATAAATDDRVRLTSEAISGVLACKTLSWEEPLFDAISSARNKEAYYIKQMNTVRAMNMAFTFSIAPLASLITFATARGTGSELTVANIFYAIALLNLPKQYMAEFFVLGVEATSELRASVRRIAEFLSLQEPSDAAAAAGQTRNVYPPFDNDNNDNGYAIIVHEDDYDWNALIAGKANSIIDTKKKNTKESTNLTQLPATTSAAATATAPEGVVGLVTRVTLPRFSLHVKKGQLLAIVGAVGAGKSSIVSVILGELQPKSSSSAAAAAAVAAVVMDVQRGTDSTAPCTLIGNSNNISTANSSNILAYSQQIPWIMSDTIRENILFGQPYNNESYNAVIKACALDTDFHAMPAGDLTEVGERGVSLSGGQKARLSLARAAYSHAAVVLLDDPLSAVDPKVGRILFDRCIGPRGLMSHSTRVLVTHQRQYLRECDRILVVQQGKVIDDGRYDDLVKKGYTEVVPGIEGRVCIKDLVSMLLLLEILLFVLSLYLYLCLYRLLLVC